MSYRRPHRLGGSPCCTHPTHTPAVMLTKWHFGMDRLPAYELTKAFRLLVALFSIADTRRRTLHCAGGCGHEWHNLSGRP
ncbi:DUF5958 family protein [Streptomyces sp. NPDC058989]|uniref:DUF5958 family protein n=1 Tax=Streptomyces sp. NPDC058989 TaxID=3346686 RepID=UPI0036A9143F